MTFFRSLIKVFSGNVVLLISQILVGLVLPKILSLDSFGNYRIFMLYGSYAGLLHFGFVDGILFVYGGRSFNDIEKKTLSEYFSFFIVFEFFVSILIVFFSLFFLTGKYKIIFLFVGLYCFVLNVTNFFQFFSQAIMRFGLIARASFIQAILTSSTIIILLIVKYCRIFNNIEYWFYIVIYIIIYSILLFMYMFIYLGKVKHGYHALHLTSSINFLRILKIFEIGLPITIAYQIANITLNLDNQFVSIFFDATQFAKYSFAYNLVSITISIVLALSTVLFPYLNKQSKEKSIKQYSQNTAYLLFFVYASLMSYYPIEIIIKLFLPKYMESLRYFQILSPGVAITICITVIVSNYYKVMNENLKYLKNGCVSLLITSLLDISIYLVFRSVISMAYVSLIELFIWYLLEDSSFRRKYHIKGYETYAYIILMVVGFEASMLIPNLLISFVFYLLIYVCISVIFMKEHIIRLFLELKKLKKE